MRPLVHKERWELSAPYRTSPRRENQGELIDDNELKRPLIKNQGSSLLVGEVVTSSAHL